MSIFTYGQTASGKTHTMKGTKDDPGLLIRTLKRLFEPGEGKNKKFISARMSYFEVYNETINDLLDPSKQNLDVREDKDQGVFIKDLTQTEVHDLKSALVCL